MGANDLMYFTDQQLIDTLGGNAAGASGKLDGDDEDVHTTTIHIDGDNDWDTLIEGMD